jgi:hypothetical protein
VARVSEGPIRRALCLQIGVFDTVSPGNTIAPMVSYRLQRGEYDWYDLTVPQAALNGKRALTRDGRDFCGNEASTSTKGWTCRF